MLLLIIIIIGYPVFYVLIVLVGIVQLVVGGKKSKISTLHLATEKGLVNAAKLILSNVKDAKLKESLLQMTTIIVPEGQRPRPLTCLHIAAKCGINGRKSYKSVCVCVMIIVLCMVWSQCISGCVFY